MVEVLGLDQASLWQSVLDESDAYDFYHLPGYHALEEKNSSAKSKLFIYRNGSAMAAFPLIISPLEELGNPGLPPGGWCDATSVYGYPGPICNVKARTQDGFFSQFGQEIVKAFKQMKIVAAFSRLNPVLDNDALLKSIGETVYLGPTVSIDLSKSLLEQSSMFRKDHKDGIRKARSLGMKVYHDTSWEHFEDFLRLYEDTMKRVNAEKQYFFTRDYFWRLREVMGSHIHLFVAEYDGKMVGGSIFIQTGSIVQYHLSASDLSFKRASGSKLILDEARSWAKESGGKFLHLGGGVGAQEDNLFLFKSGFSSLRHQFVVWRLIVEQGIYESLVEHHRHMLGNNDHPQNIKDFFPLYRAPIELPSHELKEKEKDNSVFFFKTNNVSKKKVLIIGAGGHARVVADAILSRYHVGEKYEIVGFLDDDERLQDQVRRGMLILGRISDIDKFEHDAIVIGIGDNLVRQNIYLELKKRGEKIITVVHPRATIALDVEIGEGSVFFAGVVVNSGTRIGSNVIVNTAATVDHDSVIGSHTHICPGVHLGGGVTVGEGAFIGIGSSVIHNKTIGNWAIIGGGAAVIRDVAAFSKVVGVPARPI